MLFFPYKADILLPKIPILTIFISILCLFIYWQQQQSDIKLFEYSIVFCEQQDSRMHKIIMKKIAKANNVDDHDVCLYVYLSINTSSNAEKQIAEIVEMTSKFSTKSLKKSHEFMKARLAKKSIEFEENAPESLSGFLQYDPESLNIFKMITSAFAHGSWMHVIGNLFFFFAFAATIEAILGRIFYSFIVLTLAIGTNLVYSFAVMASPEALPTLGLSGVVMGMMGLFTYFVPTAKIRCFFWILIFVRRFGIYAWMLALWYFGWDLYGLYDTGTSGGVNLVAHVSGFIEGYLIGLLLFKRRKQQVHAEIRRSENSVAMSQAITR